jgi:hypothetical protein
VRNSKGPDRASRKTGPTNVVERTFSLGSRMTKGMKGERPRITLWDPYPTSVRCTRSTAGGITSPMLLHARSVTAPS